MQDIILVCNGSFNPVHLDHVEMMITAKQELKKQGYNVVRAYMTTSSDKYVKKKLKGAAISHKHRVNMLNIATKDIDWLHVKGYGLMCEQQVAEKIGEFETAPVYIVMGSDTLNRMKWMINAIPNLVVIQRDGDKHIDGVLNVSCDLVASSTKVRDGDLSLLDPKVKQYYLKHVQ